MWTCRCMLVVQVSLAPHDILHVSLSAIYILVYAPLLYVYIHMLPTLILWWLYILICMSINPVHEYPFTVCVTSWCIYIILVHFTLMVYVYLPGAYIYPHHACISMRYTFFVIRYTSAIPPWQHWQYQFLNIFPLYQMAVLLVYVNVVQRLSHSTTWMLEPI